ncbi:MAG: dTDP-4-dehydrorhamnose reductase [Citrobacter freundii]|nr:MAG: dTDP-4-dehydrorhamnose reductase [Citrobacter freundii]
MDNRLPYAKPEIWGGFECTINRTDEGYADQLERIGHYSRIGDLEKACDLGLTRFRFPVLWERHYPADEKQEEWEWTANQLQILQKRNVEVIAGLVHHGSGPPDTDLLDRSFPEKLSSYARDVAVAFPWIRYYTPVNEPLTTARFSGLYGIWYPHLKDDASFARMLINQLKGIVLSMQAIRTVNPRAMLVQTEDLSKTHSTALLSYQADFENQRRWFTYDFLTGKVDKTHFAWNYFITLGVKEDELQFFLDNICTPEIAGFNYYVTSERYLDEDISRYTGNHPGTNGIHTYCDTEAARSMHMQGAATLLKEAWWRYRIPMALTECQLACTREHQLRWFNQHFKALEKLNREGIPVTAITAWGLLGATDWDCLLSSKNGHYETGAFDCSGAIIRSTALAPLIRTLARGADYFHPALNGRGWWERCRPLALDNKPVAAPVSERSLLILYTHNLIADISRRACGERGLDFLALPDYPAEPVLMSEIYAAVENNKHWAVLLVTGPGVESNRRIDHLPGKHTGPDDLAALCNETGIPYLHLTTGEMNSQDLSCIEAGSDKSQTNEAHCSAKVVLIDDQSHSAVENGLCFCRVENRQNISRQILRSIRYGDPFFVSEDLIHSPVTEMLALINISLDLLIDESALNDDEPACGAPVIRSLSSAYSEKAEAEDVIYNENDQEDHYILNGGRNKHFKI